MELIHQGSAGAASSLRCWSSCTRWAIRNGHAIDCCSAGVGHALELPQRLSTWDTYSVVPHSLPKWVTECDGSRGDESVALTGWPRGSKVLPSDWVICWASSNSEVNYDILATAVSALCLTAGVPAMRDPRLNAFRSEVTPGQALIWGTSWHSSRTRPAEQVWACPLGMMDGRCTSDYVALWT